MSTIQSIKTEIQTILNELITSGDLGGVIVSDFRKDITDYDIASYPTAILTTPAIRSETLTNRDNLRTLEFNIVIIDKGENISSTTQIETLIETILNKFDNNPTLNGLADGGVVPSTSEPEVATIGDKSYIAFMVILQIKISKSLTF